MNPTPPSVPDVSIVVPIYNEVENLPDLVARIGQAMAGQPLSFELLAVDDGSTDGSRAQLRELAATTRARAASASTASTAPSASSSI